MAKITRLTHPDWLTLNQNWFKYRLIMQGGKTFVDKYLIHYSSMEADAEFQFRRRMSYAPAFAQVELLKVHHAVARRFPDVIREGTVPDRVTIDGDSPPKFMGKVLLELLTTGRVGIYVDRAADPLITMADDVKSQPYVYAYNVEDILNWNSFNQPTDVLLQDNFAVFTGGLVNSVGNCLRHVYRDENGQIVVETGDAINDVIVQSNEQTKTIPTVNATAVPDGIQVVNIPSFPFKIFNIRDSLLVNVADYQIALLNQESMQNFYAFRLSHPVYVEQSGGQGQLPGEQKKATEAVDLGPFKGRTYPPQMDPPSFIAPPMDGMVAKEKRIEQLKADIKELMLSTVATLASSSQQVKAYENTSFEDGLSAIATVLEEIENWIWKIWAEYRGTTKPITAVYPKVYAPESNTERITNSKSLLNLVDQFPSNMAKKTVIKMAFRQLTVGYLNQQQLDAIYAEMDIAKYISSPATDIIKDVEIGLVTKATASEARGYPKGEAETAEEEHIERIAAIATAQGQMIATPGGVQRDPAAAGIKEASLTPEQSAQLAREVQGGGRKGTGDTTSDA